MPYNKKYSDPENEFLVSELKRGSNILLQTDFEGMAELWEGLFGIARTPLGLNRQLRRLMDAQDLPGELHLKESHPRKSPEIKRETSVIAPTRSRHDKTRLKLEAIIMEQCKVFSKRLVNKVIAWNKDLITAITDQQAEIRELKQYKRAVEMMSQPERAAVKQRYGI